MTSLYTHKNINEKIIDGCELQFPIENVHKVIRTQLFMNDPLEVLKQKLISDFSKKEKQKKFTPLENFDRVTNHTIQTFYGDMAFLMAPQKLAHISYPYDHSAFLLPFSYHSGIP